MDTIYILNYEITEYLILVIKNWYWLPLPFLLWPFFSGAWLWWRREKWEAKQKYIFLEIIPPKEIMKPLAAMEHVFTNIWSIHSGIIGWKKIFKKWWDGKKNARFHIKILHENGQTRFFLRLHRKNIDIVRSAFYAQYPELEIREILEDYTQKMDWNLPDKNGTLTAWILF